MKTIETMKTIELSQFRTCHGERGWICRWRKSWAIAKTPLAAFWKAWRRSRSYKDMKIIDMRVKGGGK